MPFDWQAELSSPSTPPISAAMVVAPPDTNLQRISFAQALAATPKTSSNENMPKPLIRGESVSITIMQQIYEKGLEICKHNLRGRLILNKGDKPYTTKVIHLKLQKQWKTTGDWSMRPLGRGYFEFTFSSDTDLRMVWASGNVNLKPGVLRLFEWTKDFDMNKQRNTHAQVWIRLMELPQEYWMDRTLREIASAVGTPLIIDNATTKRLYGHYARMLVDMDFSRKMFHEITVEREGYSFVVEVAYEWLPDFCSHCHNIGHDVTACRWLYPHQDNIAHKQAVAQGKKPEPTKKQTWTPVTENPSGIGSSLAFAHPQQATPKSEVPLEPTAQVPPTIDPILEAASSPPPHDITMTVPVQQDISLTSAKHLEVVRVKQEILEVDNSNVQNYEVEENLEQPRDIPSDTVNSTALSQKSLNMQLDNVTNEHVCTKIINVEPILTPVRTLDVSSIAANPNAIIDPTLRNEMDFMQTWLEKAAATEVPFTQ